PHLGRASYLGAPGGPPPGAKTPVSDLRNRLEARLVGLGWRIADRHFLPGEPDWVTPERWLLESSRPPRGVKVEVDLRIVDRHWFELQLLSVSVRYPLRDPDEPSPEATLMGAEAQAFDYRQLSRVLEWFRDPLSGVLWQGQPDDWMPPASWE